MKTISGLIQGSEAWLAHRRTTRNASDASVMMGASPNISRREFVKLRATGLEREFSDYVQKYILDRGHEVEPALRMFAEGILGEDLYPVTGVSDDGYLGASFDGVTLLEDIIFEAKQPSAEKMELVRQLQIPPQDYWQVVQQFAVCELADRCLYVVGDGTDDNTVYMDIPRSQIAVDIPKLLAGWKQFEDDVATYQPEPDSAPAPTGRAPESLPALSVQVTGMVTASNLAEFKSNAMAVLGSINRELKTDEDFADAETTVKWCQGVEERLEATKQQVLGQTADIEAVFRTMDEVKAEARKIRLELDKLVTKEKENRKAEIVQAGATAVRAHYDTINATLGEHRMQPPQSLMLDIGAVIKGKKSLSSMKDAVDTAVASLKIAASESADRVRANVVILAEYPDHASLFADRVALCANKSAEDLRNLVTTRIADHNERERVRQEAQATVAATSFAPATAEIPATTTPVAVQPMRYTSATTVQASAAKIKLGDLNARIAPLTISADGLRQLGFDAAAKERGATLYREDDFPRICLGLAKVLEAATQTEAA